MYNTIMYIVDMGSFYTTLSISVGPQKVSEKQSYIHTILSQTISGLSTVATSWKIKTSSKMALSVTEALLYLDADRQ
jgi:hypothetical protein